VDKRTVKRLLNTHRDTSRRYNKEKKQITLAPHCLNPCLCRIRVVTY